MDFLYIRGNLQIKYPELTIKQATDITKASRRSWTYNNKWVHCKMISELIKNSHDIYQARTYDRMNGSF